MEPLDTRGPAPKPCPLARLFLLLDGPDTLDGFPERLVYVRNYKLFTRRLSDAELHNQ